MSPTSIKPKASSAKTRARGKDLSSVSRNGGLGSDDLMKLYHYMRLMREFEDAILRLYQQGKIVGGAYSGNGNEATAVGSSYALKKEDYLFPMHRDMGAHLVKGQTVLNLMLQHLARESGATKGRDGTGHYSDPDLRIYGNISHLGSMVPVACGVALANKLKRENSVVMTYIGDGGANVGEVHEALAMASVMRLPLVLIVENNQYAYSTPIKKQFLVANLSDRAAGYGIPGITIDGTDVIEVYRACKEAVDRARRGEGPSIIEAVTMRMHGHAAHDNAWYVPKDLLSEWKKKDPIERCEKLLNSEGLLKESKKESIVQGIRREIEKAIEKALNEPYPPAEEAGSFVYAAAPDSVAESADPSANQSQKSISYLEAISEGLREEMRRDEKVFLLGEDIGTYGGAFKVTKGFIDEFGEDRVIDTVLAEAAILGAASGAALTGLKPVAEMQFADFVTNGFNQLVNIAAKFHYRNFVSVPIVVRLPTGGGIHGGPFHSVNPEAWFFHVPGLKLVAPSTPYDAKGLIKAAIRDPNPVLYFEHKYLYRHVKGEIPEGDYFVPIGKADIKRQGSDISVITYSTGVHWSLEAAATLASEGIDVEVVDLRTLLPLDRETILNSVRKTGKVLIVHEATLTGGIGGELAAIISEDAFIHLDAPIKRVASLDAPVPYAPTLEEYFLPNAKKVTEALRSLARF